VTSDGAPVVIHDYELARTTSGIGYVHELTADNVCSLDAGLWFDKRFAGEQVPLLEEVLSLERINFELEVKGVPSLRLMGLVSFWLTDQSCLCCSPRTFTSKNASIPHLRAAIFPFIGVLLLSQIT